MGNKVSAGIMSVFLAVTLAACGSSAGTASNSVTETADTESVSTGNANSSAAPESGSGETASSGSTGNGSDSLIVYFDYSENMGDTSGMSADAITSASLAGMTIDGITENDLLVMRDEIRKQTGADVFSVQVTEPYDPDYNTMVGMIFPIKRLSRSASILAAVSEG